MFYAYCVRFQKKTVCKIEFLELLDEKVNADIGVSSINSYDNNCKLVLYLLRAFQ